MSETIILLKTEAIQVVANLTCSASMSATEEAIHLTLFAYDRNTNCQVFEETLGIDGLKALFKELSAVSVIAEGDATNTGHLVQIPDGHKQVTLSSDNAQALDILIDGMQSDQRIATLLKSLSPKDLMHLDAARRAKTYRAAIDAFDLLIGPECEAKGDVVAVSKSDERLVDYSAGQPEKIFQNWVEKNLWVLGVEVAKKLDHRAIAIGSECDIMVETADGFIDLVEMKRPNMTLLRKDKSHDCYCPTSELSAALGQALHYAKRIDEYRLNLQNEHNIRILRPRVRIIAGRSNEFCERQRDALRMLNSSLVNIEVIPFDELRSMGTQVISNYDGTAD